ncbi:MAG: RluA family pseudouridine synthase [Desulfobacterales bacterium]|jgi:23S rRNA pseudouridine1911/1915/1917 synthase|nr:RluA family pseudouridine synthase [Desulfobacteraceae bacterium]MBT4363908.1 RluA family pseudouridine synthase [Desulfobacteraceae bacterium]MBT7085227.1 RluA family pseudouridine synthase [Desulfobacterales bacterium]MBT7696802.1 RluA family pseudouridine synthase [Desulfobacterales bacterium]
MPDRDLFSIIVEERDTNIRLDSLVASHISDCSRNTASTLIQKGIILVQGIAKKPGYRVKTGEKISGYIPPPEIISFDPEPITIDIIYEDEHIVVVNKAAGMVVHPAPGHYTGTLVNALLFKCRDLKSIGDKLRPGIVHRLDMNTSGIIVVAKNQNAHEQLSSDFKLRKINKKYLALVYNDMESRSGVIELPIGRHPTDRKKMSVKSKKSRKAETTWQLIEKFGGLSLLELKLITGRTHQIRVHCAAINHHIVGDSVYGRKNGGRNLSDEVRKILKPAKRQLLHSWQIGFSHPATGIYMDLKAPIPEDMNQIISGLKGLGQ